MATAKSIIFPINREFLTRIFSKIKVSTENFYNDDPCWEWTGHINDAGYGTLRVRRHPLPRQVFRAHRIVYEHFVDIIPDGMYCDHLCRVRHCVNPAHIEIVTHQENDRRGLGICGINARKTHCKQGHPLEGDNLILVKTSRNTDGRACRECQRENGKKSFQRLQSLPYDHPRRIKHRAQNKQAMEKYRQKLKQQSTDL